MKALSSFFDGNRILISGICRDFYLYLARLRDSTEL